MPKRVITMSEMRTEGGQGRLVYLAMALPGWMLSRLRAAEAESGPT